MPGARRRPGRRGRDRHPRPDQGDRARLRPADGAGRLLHPRPRRRRPGRARRDRSTRARSPPRSVRPSRTTPRTPPDHSERTTHGRHLAQRPRQREPRGGAVEQQRPLRPDDPRRSRPVAPETVIALLSGHELAEHESPGEATLQVLHGRVSLSAEPDSWEGSTGDHVVIPRRRHTLTALEDAVVLLTVVKPLPDRRQPGASSAATRAAISRRAARPSGPAAGGSRGWRRPRRGGRTLRRPASGHRARGSRGA